MFNSDGVDRQYETCLRPLQSTARKNKMRLKKLNVDISHYRRHPAAIEKLAWLRMVTIVRNGQGHFYLAPPWCHPPCVRNWRFLTSEQRYARSDLRFRRKRLRRDTIIAGELTRRKLLRGMPTPG